MKRKLIIIVATVSILLGSVLILYMIPSELLVSKHLGTIEHAGNSTNLMLRKYELTGYPFEIRRWLTGKHDGAIGQQIAYIFLPWGVRHPYGFAYIIEGIEPENRPRFVSWLGSMVGEAMIEREFLEVFDWYETPVITDLKLEVEKQKKWQQH
ncbi:MAG: hypothetical protein IPL32_07905 [Chloracidobacterium sp.]|nr:hypothetical protein [Chloracidobacterium sp.]